MRKTTTKLVFTAFAAMAFVGCNKGGSGTATAQVDPRDAQVMAIMTPLSAEIVASVWAESVGARKEAEFRALGAEPPAEIASDKQTTNAVYGFHSPATGLDLRSDAKTYIVAQTLEHQKATNNLDREIRGIEGPAKRMGINVSAATAKPKARLAVAKGLIEKLFAASTAVDALK